MNVTIILLCYNGAAYLPQCLESLYPLPPNYQLVIVDNGSGDESVMVAHRIGRDAVVVENGANYGFSGGMNIGMRLAMGCAPLPGAELCPSDAVVLLNQDTRCLPGWHEAIIAPFDDPVVAAVGCKIYASDGTTILHVGGGLEEPRGSTFHIGRGEEDHGQYETLMDVPYATGAALALRTNVLQQVGLFDERYNPGYMEEVDLCARIWQAGYRVVVNPAARLIHLEGSSTSDPLARSHWYNRGRLLFLIKTRPLAQLLDAFAAAERAYIQPHGGLEDLRALKRAYLDAILRLPDWCVARETARGERVEQHEYEQLLGLLVSLRDHCVRADADGLARQLE